MKIGVYTDGLRNLSLEDALTQLTAIGVHSIELGTGNWSPAPHIDVGRLIRDAQARQRFTDLLDRFNVSVSALNASGNVLDPRSGKEQLLILKQTIQLAGLLGVDTVVAMSGLPAAPGDNTPNWIVTAWPEENHKILERQWDSAVKLWQEISRHGEQNDVRSLALELHPYQLVYNVRTFEKLRAAVGETIRVNLDPSHLMWMGMDPIAVIQRLSETPGTIGHAHMKDTKILNESRINSPLETLPFSRTTDRAWNYVTLGHGHPDPEDFWPKLISALRAGGYDGELSIEHEDEDLPGMDGVKESVDLLRRLV